MPSRCSICSRTADLAAISDLVDAQVPLKEIASQFHCSYSALVRHCARHRNPAAPEAGSAGTDIAIWLSRAEDQYKAAVFDNDQRGAIQALVAGLRACEAKAKQAERDQEVAEEAGEDDGRISIQDLDGVVELLTQTPDVPADQAKIKIALDKARILCKPDMVAVFYRAYENFAFASDLMTWAASWQPAQKGDSDAVIQTETARAN
jgi:hypothetical protein